MNNAPDSTPNIPPKYSLDYSLLEGIAIGSIDEVREKIATDPILETSRHRLAEDDILTRVEQAARESEFPTTLYYDHKQDSDICFALNPTENVVLYAESGKGEWGRVGIRPIGHIGGGHYSIPIESPREVFEEEISRNVPISYGMYTMLRIRYQLRSLSQDLAVSFLHNELSRETNINALEARKWTKTVYKLLNDLI